MGKVWLIASGKGGVGKSTITAALGWALAAQGSSACVIDGDIGLRDLDSILGVANRIVYDLLDVCRKDCKLGQALVEVSGRPGLTLLPAAQFARCKELERGDLRKVLTDLKQRFDFILIDCPAGIERGLRGLMTAETNECVIVCTPDDVCIRDAEQTVSLLAKKGMPRPQLIVNRLRPNLIASGDMYSAKVVSETLDLCLLGEIPEDERVCVCTLRREPLIGSGCEAARAVERIAARMAGLNAALPQYGTQKARWWKRLFRS